MYRISRKIFQRPNNAKLLIGKHYSNPLINSKKVSVFSNYLNHDYTKSSNNFHDQNNKSNDINLNQDNLHPKRKIIYYGIGIILLVSGLGIYFLVFADNKSESVQKLLKYAAKSHLENLKNSGNSVEQRKKDYDTSLIELETLDNEEFEKFLKEIEENDSNKSFILRGLEYFRVFTRFIYLFLRLFPLYISSYFLSKDLWNEFVFRTFRDLGPCWIKLGQWIATRIDLFDPDLCLVLSKFHGEGYVHSFKDTKKIIEKSFNKKLEDIFDEFIEKPIGSGSIAQVYKAKLKDQDEYVAVKVRHPNVGSLLSRDLRVLKFLCQVISIFPKYKWMNLDHNIVNFARNMNAQVDLRFESQNLERFIENFKDIENVKFPKPYMSTSDVLIEEYMDMKCIKEFINSPSVELKKTLAELGVFIYLKMLVKDNFLHGDLHSGNLFVTFLPIENDPNRLQPCIVVLDAGLVNQLTPENRASFLQLFAAFVVDDAETVSICLLEDNFMNTYLHYPEKLDDTMISNMHKFTVSIKELLQNLNHAELGQERKVGPAAQSILVKAQEYKIPLQTNFTNLIISSIIVEGVGRLLYPDIPFLAQCEDLLRHSSVEQAKNYLKDKIVGYKVFGSDTKA